MKLLEHGVTEARDGLSQLLNDAERGTWTVVRDRSGNRSVLADSARLWELLGRRSSAPGAWIAMADARAQFSHLHQEAHDAWVGIARRGREFALVGEPEVTRRLTRRYRFTTEVIYEPGGTVALWVPELALFGRGASYDEARSDLLEEVDAYLDDWLNELHTAPNHRAREGWVRRLLLLPDADAQARALLEG